MVAPCNTNDIEQGRPETPPDDQRSKCSNVASNGSACNSEDNVFHQDVYDDSTSEESSSISNDEAQVAECRSGGNEITLKQCEGPIHIGDTHTSTNIIIADKNALPQVLAAAEKDCFQAIGFNINDIGLAGSPDVNGELQTNNKLQRYGKLMAAVISLILVLVMVVASLQIFQLRTVSAGNEAPEDTYDGEDIPHGNVTLVTRRQCLLERPAAVVMQDLKVIPPKYVIISHTANSECLTQKDCCQSVRNVQSYQVRKGFSDIGYQFLIGGDGRAYEGRQWNKTGAHTITYNCASFGVSFIGNFIAEAPRDRQVEAAALLLDQLVQNRMLQSNYTLYYHGQLSATESPGKRVIDIVKTWPHWSSELPGRC